MAGLTQATCVPCRGGIPPLDHAGVAALKPQVADWDIVDVDGVSRLRRSFKFPDFKSAMAFAVAVGELAEREQHHPDLHIAWGKVVVEVWTHKIGGLHENDFILAAKTDVIHTALGA